MLLINQLTAQQTYMEEAKTRNAQYDAFQHDIKKHLLVLSGLIQEEKLCRLSGILYIENRELRTA